MKATTTFEKTISDHLQTLAENDALFAQTLAKPNKNITECVNYIMNTVKQSGNNGFADEEIYSMAIHYYDEDNIKNVKPVSGQVIVNHSIAADKNKVSQTTPIQKPAKLPVKTKSAPVAQMPLF